MKLAQFHRVFQNVMSKMSAYDQEQLTHLKSNLVPLLTNSIGATLDIPCLYETTLHGLQRNYGNPGAVAAACSSELLKIQPFNDEDPQGLRRFSLALRSIVNTLEFSGSGGELPANSSLHVLEDKLPTLVCEKWAVYSDQIAGYLPNVSDLNTFLETETRLKFSYQLVSPDSKTPGKQQTINRAKSKKPGQGPRVHSTSVAR